MTGRNVTLVVLLVGTSMLAGCITRIEGRVVNVSVSPSTNLRVQALPLP